MRKLTKPVGGFEYGSWLYMRLSGIAILVLVSIHLIYVHFVHGVDQVNYKFVATRWSSPAVLAMDVALLIIALLHGANGVRILIDDYIRSKSRRNFLHGALYVVTAFLLVFGGLVMLVYRPQ